MAHVEGQDEANKALRANLSPRAKRLANFEAYVSGTQYDGRPDWFADDAKVSLFARKPCVIYPIVRAAIDSNADLLLGDGRFPVVTSRPDEADAVLLSDGGNTNDEQSKVVDAYVSALHRATRFRQTCIEVFRAGQGTGSACAIHGVRNGRPVIDTVKSRWCEPEFGIDGKVTCLVIQYPYVETVKQNGAWVMRAMLYRRVIDNKSDTTFLPAIAQPDGREPAWIVDATACTHNLGFCPVVWYAHMRECSIVGNYDGIPIHEHALDMITAHDFACSMRHRAALYSGDPQWTECGVTPGYNPTGAAPRGGIPSTARGGPVASDNPVTGHFAQPASRGGARKKGPGQVWQYMDKDVKVTLHTLPGEALKALDENATDLRIKISESLCVVFMDPEHIKFAASVSGKALETLKQRQLDRVDQLRGDFGDNFILPSTDMLLRVSSKVGASLQVPGVKKALPILRQLEGAA